MLFSSHQLGLVENICEQVAIVDHGRIVATGDVDALRRKSQWRRIELRLEGAPSQWLPDVAGVELTERRNGDLRLLAGRDVDPGQVFAEAERTARVVEFSYGPPTLEELLTARAPHGLDAALQRAAKPFDAKVRLHVLASAATGREELAAENVDALLLLPEDRLVFRANVDTRLAAVADTAVRALPRHLPPAPELTTATLEPPDAESTDAATLVAMTGSLLLLVSLAVYGQWVLVGVVEEKNNRVVELILSTVRPRDLLAAR